jgi:hypothetical protein
MNTIPKELQALAPGLRFCDAKHPGVSFAAERCPVCVVVDLNNEMADQVGYLNTQIDELRTDLNDFRALAKKHRLI